MVPENFARASYPPSSSIRFLQKLYLSTAKPEAILMMIISITETIIGKLTGKSDISLSFFTSGAMTECVSESLGQIRIGVAKNYDNCLLGPII